MFSPPLQPLIISQCTMSNQAIKHLSVVRTDEQLFANVLNIDFLVYSFGNVVSNKRQANTVSTSNGAGTNTRERELVRRTPEEMTAK